VHQFRHPDETYRALWKAQPWDQPPLPALVDRAWELGLDEFAWRLQWCNEHGIHPLLYVNRQVSPRRWFTYRWFERYGHLYPSPPLSPLPSTAAAELMRHGRAWSPSLLVCYSKLLRIPRGVFSAAACNGSGRYSSDRQEDAT
jgi:hypothetical protein